MNLTFSLRFKTLIKCNTKNVSEENRKNPNKSQRKQFNKGQNSRNSKENRKILYKSFTNQYYK